VIAAVPSGEPASTPVPLGLFAGVRDPAHGWPGNIRRARETDQRRRHVRRAGHATVDDLGLPVDGRTT
jgi:hypothetical protein